MVKRLLVIALATVLGITSIPTTAYASQITEVTESVAVEEADVLYSGMCSPTASWYIDSTYTMYICGEGTTKAESGSDSWYDYRYVVYSIVIDEGITSIHDRAFYGFSNLKSVELPESLQTIGNGAFYECYNLPYIEIPDGVTSIGDSAFTGCRSLESIEMPDNLTALGEYAFEGCEKLKSIRIPDNVTQIQPETFIACYELESVSLPANLEWIGQYAFCNCSVLTDLQLPDSLVRIDASAFRYCHGLENLYIPGGITTIGDYAFDGCKGLKRVELGEGLTETGKYMFRNCTSLEQVQLSSALTKIADSTFYGCKALATIALPDQLNVIGTSAFYQCTPMSEMTIPASVTQIGDSVFEKCSNLKLIFFLGSKEQWEGITIGSTNDVLLGAQINYNTCRENHVWKDADCENAKKCELCNAEIGTALGHSYTNYVSNGDGTKTANCDNCGLSHTTYETKFTGTCNKDVSWAIDMDNTLHIFGNGQVGDLSANVLGYWNSLRGIIKKVVIEEGVTYVGSYVFDQFVNLEEVYMADTVTAIGAHLFNGCESLKKVELSKNLKSIGKYAFYCCYLLEEVEIPESVTFIGDYAFCECKMITEVVIPKGVTTIGEKAFTLCESMTTLVLPKEVTSIGYYAFGACPKLMNIYYKGNLTQWNAIEKAEGNDQLSKANLYYVVAEGMLTDTLSWEYSNSGTLYIEGTGDMPDYVTGNAAPWTSYNQSIKKLSIGNDVTSIGAYAFYNLSALQTVNIHAGIKEIGEAAFAFCYSLTDMTVDAENPYLLVQDGVLYNKDMTRLLWYSSSKMDTAYEIPATITSIDTYAFVGNGYLETLKLSENIKAFANDTFKGCSSLRKVIWDGSYDTYYDITRAEQLGTGNDSFLNADFEILGLPYVYDINDNETEDKADDTVKIIWTYRKLAGEVVVPDTIEGLPVTEIGESAFMVCQLIEKLTIPDSVTTIGKQAFDMCDALTEIVLSDNVTEIPELAFQMCSTLERITFPANLEKICEGAFSECTALKEVVIPETVTVMEDGIFLNCTALENVEIKGAIENLGITVFGGCSKLQTVTLPSTLKTIGKQAFTNCISLTSINLPEGLVSLGEGAFYKCIKLQSIALPSTVTTLGEGCFMDCSSLETVEIKSDLTYIPKSCFQRCIKLSDITLPDTMRAIDETAFAQCSSLARINLPVGLQMIREQAFCQCTSLKSVTVPETVIVLEKGAFMECTNLKTARIEANVSMLWGYTFYKSGLTSVILPGTLGYISEGDFHECPLTYVGWLGTKKSLNNLTWATGGNNNFTSMSSKIEVLCPWDYTVNSDGTSCTLETLTTTKRELKGDVIIPEYIDGYKVTALDSGALRDEKEVTSVYIPDTVTMIDQYAFYGCTMLKEVRLPNNLETMGIGAFRGCSQLDNVVLPDSLIMMEKYAFMECSSLSSIVIPGNLTTISSGAFKECSSLETVILEEGVETIEITAFSDCINLEKVVLPESLKSMEVSSFGNKCKATFYIHEGTNAETYCQKWKYTCQYIYPLKGVTLAEVIYVPKDGSAVISAKPMPENTTDEYAFIYTLQNSDNGQENEIAFLSDNTLVGIEFGETILTVTEKNTGFTAQAVVKVIPSDEEEMVLTLSEEMSEIGLQFLESRTLQICTESYGVLNPDMFIYESSDEDVITVDEEGVITAVYGEAGKAEATVTVTLKEDCYDRKLTFKVTAIPTQTDTVAIDIPILGNLWVEDATVIVNKLMVTGRSHEVIVNVPTFDKDGGETNPEIIWSTSNAKVAFGSASDEYGYIITIPENADGSAIVTVTADDYNRASAQLSFEVRDYSPRIGATAVTLNTHKTTGAEIPLYAAYDSNITNVYIDGSDDLTASYNAERNVVTIIPNKVISKITVVNLVVETDQGEYTYVITVGVSNKLPAVTIKQQGVFNLFYKNSSANIAVTVKNEVVASVELCDTPTFAAADFSNNLLTVVYAEENPADGYVKGKADTSVVLKITVEGYRTAIEKKLNLSAKETKPVLMTDTKNAKVTYLSEDGATLRILDKATGQAIDWNGDYTVTSAAEGSYVMLRTDGTELLLEPVLNEQNKFANNKTSYQVKLDVLEANWVKPITVSYTIALMGAPKLTVASKTISVNTLMENTAQTVVTADCVNASAPDYEVIPNSKNAKALSENLLFGDGWNLIAEVPIGTANGSYSYKVIPKWGEVAGAALAVTVKVENMKPTIKTAAKSNTLTLSSVFDVKQTQIIPSTYRGITGVSYSIIAQGKNAKVLENAAKIDLIAEGWNLTAAFKDKEDLPVAGSYKYNVEATLTLENSERVTLKTIAVTVKVAVPKPKVTLSKTSINLNRLAEGQLAVAVNVTGDYELSGMEVVNDKSNKLEPYQLSVTEENGSVIVEVLDDTIKDGTYKYKLAPALKIKGGEYRQETMYSALTLSVKVISGKPSLKASAKGTIDLLKRDTGIVYTITGGQNFNYAVDNVDTDSFRLEGSDAEKFTVEYVGRDNKGQLMVCVKAKADKVFSTKIANKFSIAASVAGVASEVMTKTFSVTPKQSVVKVAAAGDLNIYKGVRKGSIDIKVTSPVDVKIAAVEPVEKGTTLPKDAISYQLIDEDQDGIFELKYELKDVSKLKVGAKYKLVVAVMPEGMAENMKPQNLTITFTVKK